MTRIATTVLIAFALAFSGELGRPASAGSPPARQIAGVDVVQPLTVRSSRILGLLLALEALRQVGPQPSAQKG